VFLNTDGKYECYACSLCCGRNTTRPTVAGIRAHLRVHRDLGHMVPEYAFEGLRKELADNEEEKSMASITELAEMHRKTLKGDNDEELTDDRVRVRAARAAGGPFSIHLDETVRERHYAGSECTLQSVASMKQDGRLIAAALYLRLPFASSQAMLKALADLMPGTVGERVDYSAYWKGEYTEEAEKLKVASAELAGVKEEIRRLRRNLDTIKSIAEE